MFGSFNKGSQAQKGKNLIKQLLHYYSVVLSNASFERPAVLSEVCFCEDSECFVQAWDPQQKKDVELVDQIQRRAGQMTGELEHLSCEKRLRELGLFGMEKERLWEDFIVAFQYLKGV